MRKRHDLKAAALRIVTRVTPRSSEHPVHHFSKVEGFMQLPIALVRPNPDQPRKHFDERSLADLTVSVEEKGVLQPILVRKAPEGDGFILIAGERRWRAATAAGLKEIPAFVRTAEDALEVALIENLQRENLNPIDEAEALKKLKDARNYTLDDLGRIIGKSKVTVSESLKLLELPADIQDEIRHGSDVRTPKSQMLEIARAGSPEKARAAWEALKTGELRTVRDLRKTKKHTGGRPSHLRLEYAPEGQLYRLTLTFAKKSATRADVRAALKAAIKDLPKQLHA